MEQTLFITEMGMEFQFGKIIRLKYIIIRNVRQDPPRRFQKISLLVFDQLI